MGHIEETHLFRSEESTGVERSLYSSFKLLKELGKV